MRNILISGTMLIFTAIPAHAGEREKASRAMGQPAGQAAGAGRHAVSAKAAATSGYAVRAARFDAGRAAPKAAARPDVDLNLTFSSTPVNFAVAEPDARADWSPAFHDEVTSQRGASYAVRDTLNDYRKPRFRKTAASTMLTLRLDGKDDTSSFSVGGGGVSSVLWAVVPKN